VRDRAVVGFESYQLVSVVTDRQTDGQTVTPRSSIAERQKKTKIRLNRVREGDTNLSAAIYFNS